MKNMLLVVVLMFGASFGSFAQNGNGEAQLVKKAKIAAKNSGCLVDYNGKIEAHVTVVSSCFAGGFVTEVLLVPVCNGQGCETVRLAPLAKVTFYCSDEVGSVECY